MKNNTIIAISREYGTGGRDIGRLLASELGIPLFDKEIQALAMERSNMSEAFIEKHNESVPSKLKLNLQRLSLNVPARIPTGPKSHHMSAYAALRNNEVRTNEDQLFQLKVSIVKEIASQGSCVIVGRCASWVLQHHPDLLSVFIRADIDQRVRRSIHTYGNPADTALADVKQIDKRRANYYKMHTGQTWGALKNYDLVVNSTYTGIEGAVQVIKATIDNRYTLGGA